jgi:putative holliday junction resolvase
MPEGRARVIVAFDFGLRRIGIATGSTISATATPCSAIEVGTQGIDWAAIERVLRDYQPDLLVVGNPRNADGSAGRLNQAAKRFAAELAARAGRAVHHTDEFGSSLEAAQRLKQQRQSGQRRRRVQRTDIDSAAAAIILERWLAGEGRAHD